MNRITMDEVVSMLEEKRKTSKEGDIINLNKLNLRGMYFEYINFNHVAFSGCDLTETVFFRCYFFGAKLNSNKFLKTKFNFCNLNRSDFSHSNLIDVDFSNSYLKHSTLKNIGMSNSILKYINMNNSDLSNSHITNCDFRSSFLTNANISNSDLSYSDFYNADLYKADLQNCSLGSVNFYSANLFNTNLNGAKTDSRTDHFYSKCPTEGSFIGFKKAGDCIIKLKITEDAKRSNATTNKCRCSKAKVLNIENIISGEKIQEIQSDFDIDFIYKVGEIVEEKSFDNNRWVECSSGIHFFITKDEAINY